MPDERRFASRGGVKLLAALNAFHINPIGQTAADFGCNVGGFTDCWLEHGAEKVFAIDTAYGVLAWKLRKDPRVVVMERTNALHAPSPEPVTYVSIDAGWTRQALIVPAAVKWLKNTADAAIITLIKPHYESDAARRQKGVLAPQQAEEICRQVVESMRSWGVVCRALIRSPIAGQKGNVEYLAHLTPMAAAAATALNGGGDHPQAASLR
jgi:23S rRNA (cytidine1920-2'-O)/16S rRNA (cytidine1409-2'-O)-methyltransferase